MASGRAMRSRCRNPATCTGFPRCSSRCPITPAPTSTRSGISTNRASRSASIRWRTASCPASASICATLRRAPRSHQEISKPRRKRAASKCPRAARCCFAPAITPAPFRASNMRATIPASMSPPPNGWRARASYISASTRCGRDRKARSTRWCTRRASISASPTSKACAILKRCSARAASPSSACR
jgi:hypothetical protein